MKELEEQGIILKTPRERIKDFFNIDIKDNEEKEGNMMNEYEESKNKDNFDYRMMIVKIINDICEAYYNQLRKNKDGTRYKVIISPALFNRVCDYDVDLIQINEYDNYFIMGIPLAKDFTMNGLKWELCIVKNSKNYDDKPMVRKLNIFLADEIYK